MAKAEEESLDAIDRSVLAGLKELQEEGEPDIVAEIVGLFIEHAPKKLLAIEQAGEKGDAKGLQIASHSLKSSSAYVGAMKLSAMCKDLEAVGRSGTIVDIEEKIELMNKEYKRVENALGSEIRSINSSQSSEQRS